MNHRKNRTASSLSVAVAVFAAACVVNAAETRPVKPVCTTEPANAYLLLPPCRASAGTGIRLSNDGIDLERGQTIDFADTYSGPVVARKGDQEYVWIRVRGENVLIPVVRP